MRFFFTGPRIFGIRPGVSFGASDFQKMSRPRQAKGAGQMTGSFVYVIKGAGNHHKIGVSTDPIARLAALQTGCHEPLEFAYIGVTPGTGFGIEAAAHDILKAYRQSGEWFAVPASIGIGAVMEAAGRLGEPIQQVSAQVVPQIIHLANQPDAPRRNPFKLLLQIVLGSLVGMVMALIIVVISHSPH